MGTQRREGSVSIRGFQEITEEGSLNWNLKGEKIPQVERHFMQRNNMDKGGRSEKAGILGAVQGQEHRGLVQEQGDKARVACRALSWRKEGLICHPKGFGCDGELKKRFWQ